MAPSYSQAGADTIGLNKIMIFLSLLLKASQCKVKMIYLI